MRRINLLARLQLDFANGQDVFRALVQGFDELRVELIDGLPMFGNVHREGRMQKPKGRIKPVCAAKHPSNPARSDSQ